VQRSRIHPARGLWRASNGRSRRSPAVPARAVAAAVAAGAAVAGCTAAGAGGAVTSTTLSVRDQAIPVYRELTRCIREHGYPDFPDPVVRDDGSVELPDAVQDRLDRQEAALTPCKPILQRLPASARDRRKAATPEEAAQLRRLAQCMRQNGLPEWPDPRSDGTFPLTDQIQREGKSPRLLNAMRRCADVNPDPKKGLSFSGGPGGK
jgi:hypothetical protein